MSFVQAAASATRSFLTGGLAASAARVFAGAAPRPGVGTLCTRPATLGLALAGCAVVWHAARRAAKWLGVPRDAASRAAFAGAVAAAALARLRPDLAGAATELHAGVVFSAARTLSLPRRADAADGSARWRARAGEALASLAPVALACASTWRLLHAHATARVVGHTWLSRLAPAAASAAGDATLVGVARAAGADGALAAARAALPVHAAFNARTLARGTPGAARRVALTAARELAAAALVSAASAALLRAGGDACARGGWLAGLAALVHPRRASFALRLGYQAALCGGDGGGAWRAALEPLLLGGAAARLLHQYARRVRGEPSALDADAARALHFLLGIDAEDGGDSELGGEGSTGDDGVVRPLKPEANG